MLTVKEVLTDKISLDTECIDRVYLNSLTLRILNEQSKIILPQKQGQRMRLPSID
jgi:hypothetical protein